MSRVFPILAVAACALACEAAADEAVGWNANAEWFMYAPSFAFKEVPGAADYRFRVLDDCHVTREFTAAKPTESLSPVWEELPKGFVTVTCLARDAKGETVGLAGERTFWKNAAFRPGAYPKAKRPYAEAVRMGLEYLLDRTANRYFLEHGRPDPSYDLNCYPAKMHAATVEAMCDYLKLDLPRKDEALKLARLCADYLIAIAEPEGRPLAGWPHTYEGTNNTAAVYAGQQMLVYPAKAGSAFLSLRAATGDARYLDAARRIAARYLDLQGDDGTWYLKLYERDGKPVNGNRLMPNGVIDFLERLHGVTGEVRYRQAADRAFAYIDKGPLVTWNWEGQFEDVPPSEPYFNLTKHFACDTAIYLLRRFPEDKRRQRQAAEILRWSEDQFIAWETPARKDGIGFRNRPGFQPRWFHGWQTKYAIWHCPAVMEQYSWYQPIDASAAKLIRTYLAYYEAAGDALAYEKARTLCDAVVNNQRDDGLSPTGWFGNYDEYHNWINCHIAAIQALQEFRAAAEPRDAAREIAAAVRADVSRPVRQGGVGGQAYWNGRSVLFMHPPAFGFAKVDGAVRYRYVLEGDARDTYRFEADGPNESLAPVWEGLPVGMYRLEVLGIGRNGCVAGTAGSRRFWKSAAFEPAACPKGVCGYAEAAAKYYDWLFAMRNTQCYLKDGKPDENYIYNSYPSKTDSAVVNAFVNYASLRPDRRDEALTVARRAADHLISLMMPAGSPLEHFPHTYRILTPDRPFAANDQQADKIARQYRGQNMIVYPAFAGKAFVNLYQAVGERKYLDAAVRIAETYAKLQGEDGTWYLKVNEADGKPVAPNRLFPLAVCDFLEKLYAVTGRPQFREVSDRAFAYVERGPLADWNWEAQFEDVEPSRRYRNLTVHTPVATALHLLGRYPGDAKRLAQARELVRFAEDQFVLWKPPFRADGTGPLAADTTMITSGTSESWYDVPGVCEQYDWYLAIDSAAAKMIRGFLALHGAEGRADDLAKAKALGDAVTIMQEKHGQGGAIPTHWVGWEVGRERAPWINCGIGTANTLKALDNHCGRKKLDCTSCAERMTP